MKKMLLLIMALVGLQACAGVDTFYRADTEKKAMIKFEEAYDVNLFTPTYQYRRVSKCGIKEVSHEYQGDNGEPEIYTTHEAVEPCKVLYSKHGWGVDTTGPVGPAVMQSATTVGSAYVLGDQIREGQQNQNVSP